MAEKYTGVKFAVPEGALAKKTVLTVESKGLIRAMKKAAKELAERGLSQGTSGNVSTRTSKGFIITTTASKLASLSDEDFVLVEEFDFEGNSLKKAFGFKTPSSETPMHHLIYKARPDVNAIIHVHDPALISEKAIAKLRLPVTEQELSYGTKDIAEGVAALITGKDAVVARNHGIVVVGKSIEDCLEKVVTLHRRAK